MEGIWRHWYCAVCEEVIAICEVDAMIEKKRVDTGARGGRPTDIMPLG